ncbi:MAG: hypothetical protein NTW16_11790 [Bacteroidetes bacterium]|nr:hypothetical protein [Bacteroidota bacterium]
MKKSLLIRRFLFTSSLLISLSLPMLLDAQDKGTVKDIRDGHTYNWVKIGAQSWMTENLDFNAQGGSWACNNDSADEVNFGRLYSWKAAQTACPKGWHVPSDKEWGVLMRTLNSDPGLKMQSMDTIGKGPGKTGKAPASLSSLLSGVRHPDGSFSGLNLWGGCWTSSKVNDTVATNVLFARGAKEISVSTNDKNTGFSVRCMKVK